MGGALVQSHPCLAPVKGDALTCTTVGVQLTGEKNELCKCVCVCTFPTQHPIPPRPLTCMGVLQVHTEAVEGEVLPNRVYRSMRGHHTHYKVASTTALARRKTMTI